jgi:hypothetical protein
MTDHSNPENPPCHDPAGPVHFFINDHRYESVDHTLTGLQIKQMASIPAADELFLGTTCGDDVVPNDAVVLVRKHDHFHSMPSPQYGALSEEAVQQVSEVAALHRCALAPQPDGWYHLIFEEFGLPADFSPRNSRLLVKLPPAYPLAAPDMFWLNPPVCLAGNGAQPQSTSIELLDGEQWQRFSWHLQPNYWQPGRSTLRDFLRAVTLRLQRAN